MERESQGRQGAPKNQEGTPPKEQGRGEQEAWQNTLGTRVEVKPLPKCVTPKVRRNLDQWDFGLRYVPALGLGSLKLLREMGVDRYLAELQRKYPKWKTFESLSEREITDHSVPRNLERSFWKQVENRSVEMPVLPGQWMAVETVEKPEHGTKYRRTPFAEKLGFIENRFNVSWDTAKSAIDREKNGILSEIGLARGEDIRFLEAIEWNLLANREGWGKTDTFEWTNTEFRLSVFSDRLVVGGSVGGGAGCVAHVRPGGSVGGVGFRAAIVLGS